MSPRIVLLNGVGSSGKSSIARALQNITIEPFLHVQMDTFFGMLPEAYQNHPKSFEYTTAYEDGKPLVTIKTGEIGERTLRGMRHAIAALAQQGNNIIIDEVIFGSARAQYDGLLSAFDFHVVGVFASLDILEAREIARGDRMIGLARWEYDRVHQSKDYDLEVDTSDATPLECAKLIKDRLLL